MKRRLFALLLCLCLLLAQLPATAFAKGETGSGVTQTGSTLCEHHPQHDESCGYTEGTEGSPCTHEHDEDCYKLVTECVHEHTAECCPEESGCIMETLDCRHEHKGNVSEADREGGLGRDEACGYVPATEGTPCSFVCEICNVQDKDSETTTTPSDGQDIGTTATPSDAKPQECTCENLCTEDNINMDCPVCGTEDADLSECEGLEAMPATPSNALPAKALAAGQARETKKVEYIFYHRSPDDGKMTRVESSVEATVVESSMTEWEGTWYVVEGNMEFNSTITVTADARLILADGCKLTSRFEIFVNEGNSLTIYGQEEGTGELGVLGSRGHAAIGSEIGQDCGTITIHGDKITANVGGLSGSDGAGIGGGDGGDGGEITITGGTVTAAVGYFGGAGIGGGARSSSDTITITGGTVMATGGYSGGAGIGGGARGSSDTIDIYGGTVTATGGYSGGAGIGGSSYGGTVTIHGGTVNASSSDSDGFNAVGIGGSGSSGGEITITGGTVTATSRGLLGFTGDGISGTFSTGEDGSAIIYASRIKAGSDPS